MNSRVSSEELATLLRESDEASEDDTAARFRELDELHRSEDYAQDIGEQASDARYKAETDPAKPTWRVESSGEFVADFVAPEYTIEGVTQRGYCYSLTALTGGGKTAVALLASACFAKGSDFAGREVEQGDVLFLAGENPDDVRARWIAMSDALGFDTETIRVHFIPSVFSIRADLERLKEEAAKLPNLVVPDTYAAFFDGDDENNNAQVCDFALMVRKITQFLSRPTVIMPTHPTKNATRQTLEPKGGSSLTNELDGNLTLWNEDGICTLHWHKKHRGANFDPISSNWSSTPATASRIATEG
jgi:hypothetical protein